MNVWQCIVLIGLGIILGFLLFASCFKSLVYRIYVPEPGQDGLDERKQALFFSGYGQKKSAFSKEEAFGHKYDSYDVYQQRHAPTTARLANNNQTHARISSESSCNNVSLWDALFFNPVYLHRLPELIYQSIGTEVTIGPCAKRPLKLKIPILIGGMGYQTTLSAEAKQALAMGATIAGTATNSGNGPFMSVERSAAEKLIIQFSRGHWDKDLEVLKEADAIEIQLGHGLWGPATINITPQRLARNERLRWLLGVEPGEPAVISSKLLNIKGPKDLEKLLISLRQKGGGVPVGVKTGTSKWLERELEIITEGMPDFIAVDGMEGGQEGGLVRRTGKLGIPTLYAIERVRRYLDKKGLSGKITFLAGGGLRTPSDFLKAMALGADAVFIGTTALQALCGRKKGGYLSLLASLVGGKNFQDRLDIPTAAEALGNFLKTSVREMQVIALCLGRNHLLEVGKADLSTDSKELASFLGVSWCGAPEEASNVYKQGEQSIPIVDRQSER